MVDYAAVAEEIVRHGLKAGADDVMANVTVNRSYQIRFAQSQPVISNKWSEDSAFVNVAVDRRVAATEIKDMKRVSEDIDRLVALAEKSQENPLYTGIGEGPFEYEPFAPDKSIVKLDEGGEYVEAAVNGAIEEGGVEAAGSFWKHDMEHFLHTSNGAMGHDHRASVYISIRAHADPEASGHDVACASKLVDFDAENAGRKAGRIAAMAKKPQVGKSGKYDIIFEPLILGTLVEEMGSRSSAFAVLAGLSPLKDKIGESVASDRVNIIDDGSVPSVNRRKFDEEGVPTRRNVVVERGVLRTYLHSTSTAKLFDQETTANANLVEVSSPVRLVVPAPHALFLEPGDYSKQELIEDTKDGLWLTNAWYTRYQSYITGDFSTIPRDGIFRIKDGEVVGSWKNVRLTDNLLNLWKQVDALGNETEQVKWWYEITKPVFVPPARARDIGITSSAE